MFSLDARNRRKLLWIAAMAAPAVTVQMMRLFDGAAPSTAPAAVAAYGDEDNPAGEAPRTLTPAQERARAFFASFRPTGAVLSPMDHADAAPPPVEPAPVVVGDPGPPPPANDPLEGLNVTAIVGRDDSSAVAMIDHRLRRPGDEVAPGWRVESIDPRHRRVTVVDQAGERRDLQPPEP